MADSVGARHAVPSLTHMPPSPKTHHRRSIRLPAYDYAQPGAYFVTICTSCSETHLQDPAVKTIVAQCWRQIPEHFSNALLDEFVVMPNHMHGIIILQSVGARHAVPLQPPDRAFRRLPPQSLHAIIASLKSVCSRAIHRQGHPSFRWQRNYYERVIRNEGELNRIRQYIRDNPLQWALDPENLNRQYSQRYEEQWRWLTKTTPRSPSRSGTPPASKAGACSRTPK